MLLEALEYLTTPAPPWARKLGYLKESIALRHRAQRCQKYWADHQARTKAAILENMPEQADQITVLGAGLCLDVPLWDLAARCERLVLVDACRLRGIRLPKNAHFELDDIDGTAKVICGNMDTPPKWTLGNGPVVSVNVVSQLAMLPLRHFAMKAVKTPEEIDALWIQILQRHVALLKARAAEGDPVLLIGDSFRTGRRPNGTVGETTDLRAVYRLPEPLTTWSWPVVPPGELRSGVTIENTVGVWLF